MELCLDEGVVASNKNQLNGPFGLGNIYLVHRLEFPHKWPTKLVSLLHKGLKV